MAIDFSALLYAPQQTILGVSVTITTEDGTTFETTALDKSVPFATADDPTLMTIRPSAVVRAADLTDAGVEASDLVSAELTMNDKTWRVEATSLRPSPNGAADGEVWLHIIELSE